MSFSVCSSSICDDERAVDSLQHSSEERDGSRSLTLHEYGRLYVILQFNITLHDKWTVYTYTYNMDMLGNTSVASTVLTTHKVALDSDTVELVDLWLQLSFTLPVFHPHINLGFCEALFRHSSALR